jgi:hypothetical protein
MTLAESPCTYPVPASRVDARVEWCEDGRWRARCRCGFDARGYVGAVEAWAAVDKHRLAARELVTLKDSGRRKP